MKYRLKYQKLNNLRFISHLDVQKVFQRAFRRADIKLLYSSGFNPHPKIHFAPPLPIFSESYGEYMDFETSIAYSVQYLKQALEGTLPENLNILEITEIADDEKNLSKSLDYAVYQITFSLSGKDEHILNDTVQKLNSLIDNNESLNIMKRNKKGKIKEIDIKPMLDNFKAAADNNKLIITANLSLRADGILSPNLLIKYIETNIDSFTDVFKQESIVKLDSLLV